MDVFRGDWRQEFPGQDVTGNAGAWSVAISRLHLKDGSTVDVPRVGVLAIIGPNNVGKSTALSEINEGLRQNLNQLSGTKVIRDIELEKQGTQFDLLAWLDLHADYYHRGTQPPGFVRLTAQSPISAGNLASHWMTFKSWLGPNLSQYLVHYSAPSERVGLAGGIEHREDIGLPPRHPLHSMQDDPNLVEQLSAISRRIFRKPLCLDRLSGSISLRVGKPQTAAPRIDAITPTYRAEISALPRLIEQGDGMRSLLGLLTYLATATFPIVIIDEPEAFLHPPQAFELGRALANIVEKQQLQVILATHDSDIIAGLLEPKAPVTIVRLDRAENTTTAHQINADDVRALWGDTTLRYSNVLDGLFHRLVVLAEGDDDCRFFAATLDNALTEDTDLPPSEVHFVSCHGKDGMPKILTALRKVGVRVIAAPDLDILNDEVKLRQLIEAAGGSWAAYEQDYRTAVSAFVSQKTGATVGDVLGSVNRHFDGRDAEQWTSDLKDEIRPLLRATESKWSEIKAYGTDAFKGSAGLAASRLLEALSADGIRPIEEGELERLAPKVAARKGPDWLPAALVSGAHLVDPARSRLLRIVGVTGASSGGPTGSNS